MHPCEPSIVQLKQLQAALFVAESTNENVQKLKAIELQIKRREDEEAAEKAAKDAEVKSVATRLEEKAAHRRGVEHERKVIKEQKGRKHAGKI